MDPKHADLGEALAPPEAQHKKPWVSPELTELPRLTDLTLQSGGPIGGIGDPGSGSTVF